MRLCLDEHYSRRIAETLRGRRHDAVAVTERAELRGLGDRKLLAAMQTERRALLTENVSDFVPLARELAARGEDHWGLVLSSPLSMPRGRDTIGVFVDALDRLMCDRPAERALLNELWWLQPQPARYRLVEFGSAPVHLSPMCDSSNEDHMVDVIDRVHDPVVADPDTVVVSTGQFHRSAGTRVGG